MCRKRSGEVIIDLQLYLLVDHRQRFRTANTFFDIVQREQFISNKLSYFFSHQLLPPGKYALHIPKQNPDFLPRVKEHLNSNEVCKPSDEGSNNRKRD